MKFKINITGFCFITCLLLFGISSCNWDDKFKDEEAAKIQQYLSSHPNEHYELKPSGLYYMDVIVGSGRQAVTHDTAYVLFTLYDISGNKLLTNIGGDTIVNPVNDGFFIAGFDEALTYMKEGGQSKAVLPSNLAWGNYTPFVYDIYLVKLVAAPGKK